MSRPSRDVAAPVRKERIPVSSDRAPLRVRGFSQVDVVGRWVLDVGDRLQVFLDAGYTFIDKDRNPIEWTDPTVSSSTGLDSRMTKPASKYGGGKLYLMALRRDLYEMDQKAKQRAIDETEADFKRPGKGKAVSSEVDYGSISMTTSNRSDTF